MDNIFLFQYVTNIDNCAVFRTNKNAPNYRLVLIDLTDPEESKWRHLIFEHPTHVLDWAAPINGDKLMVCYIQDVKVCILFIYIYFLKKFKKSCI